MRNIGKGPTYIHIVTFLIAYLLECGPKTNSFFSAIPRMLRQRNLQRLVVAWETYGPSDIVGLPSVPATMIMGDGSCSPTIFGGPPPLV